jgi:hypothetical protein
MMCSLGATELTNRSPLMADDPARADSTTCLEQARALIRAFNDMSWDRLRSLYHDDGLLVTVAGGDGPLGPDDTLAAMRRASQDVVHSIVVDAPAAIDAHAAVVSGSVRSRHAGGGFAVARRGWVVTFAEGKLYRLRVARNVAAARRLYERHGISLGLQDR